MCVPAPITPLDCSRPDDPGLLWICEPGPSDFHIVELRLDKSTFSGLVSPVTDRAVVRANERRTTVGGGFD
jgi:hypothetical protein